MYQDCNKCPLDRFQDCLLDNDLSQLIITGTAAPEELQQAWDKIYVEYCQLSQDGSYNEVFEIYKEINDLRAKITIVNNIVQHLEISFDQELVDILNVMALRCTVTVEDAGSTLIGKLNTVIARMKKWFPRLSMKERELEQSRKTNTGKMNREYFDNWLDAISMNHGYGVEASKITVARFCRSVVKISEADKREQLKNSTHAR